MLHLTSETPAAKLLSQGMDKPRGLRYENIIDNHNFNSIRHCFHSISQELVLTIRIVIKSVHPCSSSLGWITLLCIFAQILLFLRMTSHIRKKPYYRERIFSHYFLGWPAVSQRKLWELFLGQKLPIPKTDLKNCHLFFNSYL